MTAEVAVRARRVRLLLFDVDGVLTDGTILLDAEGRESKRFSIRDGTALVWARQAGLLTGVLSARTAAATTERARQLGIPIVRQQASDKAATFAEILAEQRLDAADVAYMGDDLMDLPVLSLAPGQASSYRLRRSRRDDHFCTSEVAALCLKLAGDHLAEQTLGAYLEVFTHHYLQAKNQLPIAWEGVAHQRLRAVSVLLPARAA